MAIHEFLIFCLNRKCINIKNDIKLIKYENGFFTKRLVIIAIMDAIRM